jgi:hypothetical protein
MRKLGGFECPSCGARKAMSQKTATPAPRGVRLRRRVCVGCGAKLETIEVTQQGLFELIREWFGDDQAHEIADEVFAEAIEVRKIMNTADAQRYRATRKRPLITRQPLPVAAILADARRHRLIAADYGVSRSMISLIKAGLRPRRSSGTRGGRAVNPLQEAASSVVFRRASDPATVTLAT